ncbi:glycosyltransferase family 4 protein [Marinitenerispora sediminis]|uniref:Glycosyl transferase n=1 Tax=Marinitenerispora sediminis TaxID=1931232 RepID=A0A368T869_9ACTN|nr:glycosyltransferase family 4 protein [Marinitenerispora sediminis]RCV47909.1 glycosyl transferase [Marinitenerispora sediminis]RCV60490.1 glycosyl transferase [Marinitenerispora sediminis]RCV61041.1 glycosyl transferase [Marinitenerispora sediminis]
MTRQGTGGGRRVALVGPAHPYKGGGARHTTELAHRLAAAGHDVVIESWRAQYPALLYPGRQTIDTPEGAPYARTRRRLAWYRPDGWWRAGRDLRRGADLVVLSVLSPVQVPAYLGLLAGVGRGTRTVALCHNVLPHERSAVDTALVRRLLRRVDAVLTHSPEQADLARALLAGRDADVRTAELPPHLPETPAGAPETPPRVHRHLLFFGLVRPYKGVDVLLRALAAGPPDVTLTVAGEFWGGAAELRALAGELGLGGRVELRDGYVPAAEIAGLFAGADAVVLPYRSATASQNVWLAHEHGRPVIATRTGTLPDHVRDGVDGLLCAPDDAADLARALGAFYAPGEPLRLRAGVRPVDPEPYWRTYLAELVR